MGVDESGLKALLENLVSGFPSQGHIVLVPGPTNVGVVNHNHGITSGNGPAEAVQAGFVGNAEQAGVELVGSVSMTDKEIVGAANGSPGHPGLNPGGLTGS